jgi:hypothetical protein
MVMAILVSLRLLASFNCVFSLGVYFHRVFFGLVRVIYERPHKKTSLINPNSNLTFLSKHRGSEPDPVVEPASVFNELGVGEKEGELLQVCG